MSTSKYYQYSQNRHDTPKQKTVPNFRSIVSPLHCNYKYINIEEYVLVSCLFLCSEFQRMKVQWPIITSGNESEPLPPYALAGCNVKLFALITTSLLSNVKSLWHKTFKSLGNVTSKSENTTEGIEVQAVITHISSPFTNFYSKEPSPYEIHLLCDKTRG
jgi:hypothetical protein